MPTLDVPDDVVPLLREAIDDLVRHYRHLAPGHPGIAYASSADKLKALAAQLPDDF